MAFTLELTPDLCSRLGRKTVTIDSTSYPKALRWLADNHANIHDLLINSKNELRQTVRCSIGGEVIDNDLIIPDGARVKLFFIQAGG
jgi:hypothetical protein